MPAYLVKYPGVETPRVIEGRRPIDVRRHAAKSFEISRLNPRELFDLTHGPEGLPMEQAENARNGDARE